MAGKSSRITISPFHSFEYLHPIDGVFESAEECDPTSPAITAHCLSIPQRLLVQTHQTATSAPPLRRLADYLVYKEVLSPGDLLVHGQVPTSAAISPPADNLKVMAVTLGEVVARLVFNEAHPLCVNLSCGFGLFFSRPPVSLRLGGATDHPASLALGLRP